MADARRMIFGTHVVPKEAADAEESISQKWSIMRQDTSGDALAKTLGGKGVHTGLHATQWSDSWTSMAHPQMHWEDWDDGDDTSGNRWEDVEEYWSGGVEIGTSSGVQIADSAAAIAFCYIKNTGTDNDLSVSVDNDNDYFLLVPPGGSVHWCGDTHVEIAMNRVFVKAVGGNTTIEYIIANHV